MTNEEPELSNKVAITIGAPEGVVLALADAGYDIAVMTVTNDAEEAYDARRLARKVRERGRRAKDESVDVSLGTNIQVAVRQVVKELGEVRLLVLMPDLAIDKPSERLTDADWSKLVGVNLSGVFFACRSVAREMERREPDETGVRGRIVLLSSESPSGANAAYRATKAGALELIRGLDESWAARGIRAAAIVASDLANEAVTSLVERIAGGEDVAGGPVHRV